MIKNLIFDLGVVLLDVDFRKTMNELKKLGVKNIDEIYTGYLQHGFFDSFDKGLITPSQFRDEIRKLIPQPVSDEEIDAAWNAMIIDFPEERINLVMSLRSKYRTFLLSNTNEIHFPVYNNMFSEKFHIPNLADIFEKTYYSFQAGMRKPEKEIFELVLNENGLKAEETLFIDDTPSYIDSAKTTGIKTIYLKPPKTILEVVNEINCF